MHNITGSRNGKGEKTVNPGIGFFVAYNDTDTYDESALFNVSLFSINIIYKSAVNLLMVKVLLNSRN